MSHAVHEGLPRPAVAPAVTAPLSYAQDTPLDVLKDRHLDHIRRHPDLPGVRPSVLSVIELAKSELAHLRALTNEVMRDVGLTQKLLRLINTAYFSMEGQEDIQSVSRAITLMGFDTVGRVATTLSLFDRAPTGPGGARLRHEFGHALLAATLAQRLSTRHHREESIYLTAMFQNLGNMLAWLHFPQQAQAIEDELDDHAEQHPDRPPPAALIQARELGLSYEDLNVEVARQWGWPEELTHSLRTHRPQDLHQPVDEAHHDRALCTAANDLARQLLNADPEHHERLITDFGDTWSVALTLPKKPLKENVQQAMAHWRESAHLFGLIQHAGTPPTSLRDARILSQRRALKQGLRELRRIGDSEAPMEALYTAWMHTLMDALDLQRCFLCRVDPRTTRHLITDQGLGDRAPVLMPLFRVPLVPPKDLFGMLTLLKQDTLINDADHPSILRHMPMWHRSRFQAKTFMVLPMLWGTDPFGMLYGDKADAHSLRLSDKELELVKSMRDIVLLGLKRRLDRTSDTH